MDIGEFFARYWLTFLFGLVAACITFCIRLYYKTKEKEYERSQEELKKELVTLLYDTIEQQDSRSEEGDEKLRQDIQLLASSMNDLKLGVLSIQYKVFKGDCRRLLEPNHIITEIEYEEIVNDHKAYNGLGGNHTGDSLFKSVMNKWNAQIELALESAVDEKGENKL